MSDDWQPIETAPKDGKPFLAWGGGRFATMRWCGWGEYQLCVAGGWASDGDFEFSHWMPLPEPPTND